MRFYFLAYDIFFVALQVVEKFEEMFNSVYDNNFLDFLSFCMSNVFRSSLFRLSFIHLPLFDVLLFVSQVVLNHDCAVDSSFKI